MFNTGTKKQQAINSIQSMNEGELFTAKTYNKKVASKKGKKLTLLDFAGVWNEIPKADVKELDKILANRRKTVRRSGI